VAKAVLEELEKVIWRLVLNTGRGLATNQWFCLQLQWHIWPLSWW
jgi:hypothetical protein